MENLANSDLIAKFMELDCMDVDRYKEFIQDLSFEKLGILMEVMMEIANDELHADGTGSGDNNGSIRDKWGPLYPIPNAEVQDFTKKSLMDQKNNLHKEGLRKIC